MNTNTKRKSGSKTTMVSKNEKQKLNNEEFQTTELMRRPDEYLPAFIDRVMPELIKMDDYQLFEFISFHWKDIHMVNPRLDDFSYKSMKFTIENRFTKVKSAMNVNQTGVFDYIRNYGKYISEEQKVEIEALGKEVENLANANDFMKLLEVEGKRSRLLEKWHGARYLLMGLWPEIYREQIERKG